MHMVHTSICTDSRQYNCMQVAYSEELVDASEVELLEFVDVDKVAIQ